jgi:L,D-transpeptidase ErfK/SrfK
VTQPTRRDARACRERWAATALAVLVAVSIGCSAHRPLTHDGGPSWSEEAFAGKEIPSFVLETDAKGAPVETVVGETATYTVRPGDTLLDVARWYDLGYNEIVDANPGVDPWVPQPGTELVLPTAFVLPCCDYDGIVVNLPEMRLYQYRRAKGATGRLEVVTYPVGMGRDDRRTPRGTYRVRGKTENPQWNIPPSIRREHIAERGDKRTFIPGGAADNPLGSHRIELADTLYAIHGTNIPWGIGMLVSHGCLRLYPEDIARLYPDVAVGTRVHFVYQPVKAGTRDGDTFIEAHPDVYKYTRSLASDARAALRKRGLAEGVDAARLDSAVQQQRGVPVPLGDDAQRTASLERTRR